MRKNIFNAVMLILLAAALIMWKLELLPLSGVLAGVSTFGIIIAIVMIIIIIWGISSVSFGAIFYPLAILCIIFDKTLGIESLTPWTVLIAATLLTAACHLLFPMGNRLAMFNEHKYNSSSNGDHEYEYHNVRFGESSVYIRSKKLQKADLSCKFGGMPVYFDDVEVPTGEVIINADVAFGEMELYLPSDWNVEHKVSVAFGECDDRACNTPGVEGGVHCVIKGRVKCGELEIKKI